MRAVVMILLLSLAGCLGTLTPNNPMKKKSVAPISSEAVAPVAPVAAKAASDPIPDFPPEVDLDRIDLMKKMFLTQRNLNRQILKTAESLSEIELMNFNLWLSQYGRQIKRKHVAPKHKSNSRVF